MQQEESSALFIMTFWSFHWAFFSIENNAPSERSLVSMTAGLFISSDRDF